MAIMTHAKFHFNWLMLTLIFGIWASEPPRAWRTTEKAGPDRVKDRLAASGRQKTKENIIPLRKFNILSLGCGSTFQLQIIKR